MFPKSLRSAFSVIKNLKNSLVTKVVYQPRYSATCQGALQYLRYRKKHKMSPLNSRLETIPPQLV